MAGLASRLLAAAAILGSAGARGSGDRELGASQPHRGSV